MTRYSRQQRSALRMVEKYGEGQVCQIHAAPERIGGTRYEPIYGPPIVDDAPCVVLPKSGMNSETFRMDTLLTETTDVLYIPATGIRSGRRITSSDRITVQGQTVSILGLDCYKPSGVPILYVVQVQL